MTSLAPNDLADYVGRQLSHFFPDGGELWSVQNTLPAALERLEFCFRHISAKYFRVDGQAAFNHLHGDQYAMLLYILSNEIYRRHGGIPACDKVFSLNKLLHGVDAFYAVELPAIFLFCHPVGTVLGRAKYEDFFLVYQNCTVGSNHDVDYPEIGRNVALYKGASVLGRSRVGDNCKIAADVTVIDTDVPSGSICFGKKGDFTIKPYTKPDFVWDTEFLTT